MTCQRGAPSGEVPTNIPDQAESPCSGVEVAIIGGIAGSGSGETLLQRTSSPDLRYTAEPPALLPGQTYRYHFEVTTPDGQAVRTPANGEFSTTALDTANPTLSVSDAREVKRSRSTRIAFSDQPNDLGGSFSPGHLPSVPSSFAVDESGDLQIVDWVKGRVAFYAPDGTYLSEIPGLNMPTDIAPLGEKNVLLVKLGLSLSGAVYRSGPAMAEAERVAGLSGVTVRATTSGGVAWVETDPYQWQRFDETGPQGSVVTGGLPFVHANQTSMIVISQIGRQAILAVQPSETLSVVWIDLGEYSESTPVLAEELSDGGSVIAFPVWNDKADWLMVLVRDANDRIVDVLHLPTEATELDAGRSGIRWDSSTEQIAVATVIDHSGMQIDWFPVR